MRWMLSAITAAILTSTDFAAASVQAASIPSPETLSACVAGETAKLNFSGVVSILAGEKTIVSVRGAMAGPGSAAMKPDARFNLGSAGKMFTAVAVAQLIDAGKVSLDDPIGKHVEGLTPEAAAVTVRQLLTHSGGLKEFFRPENLPVLMKARTLSDLMPLIQAEKLHFAPGTRFEYSNSGFLLLGRMVERVSGKSYGEYLQDHIFAPTGMTSTGLEPGPVADRAIGMTTMPEMPPPGAGGPPPPPGPPPGPGAAGAPGGPMMPPQGPLRPSAEAALMGNSAGGTYSTAADMQKFFSKLYAGGLTSKAMLSALTSPQIAVVPPKDGKPGRDYGFGFGVGAIKGHRWTGHNGGTLGVNVELTAFPGDGVTVIVLANRDPPVATALARKLNEVLFAGASCE